MAETLYDTRILRPADLIHLSPFPKNSLFKMTYHAKPNFPCQNSGLFYKSKIRITVVAALRQYQVLCWLKEAWGVSWLGRDDWPGCNSLRGMTFASDLQQRQQLQKQYCPSPWKGTAAAARSKLVPQIQVYGSFGRTAHQLQGKKQYLGKGGTHHVYSIW